MGVCSYISERPSVSLDRVEKYFQMCCAFFSGSYVLFTRSTSTLFSQKKKKIIGFYGIIHTFKNYFATVFSVFSNE